MINLNYIQYSGEFEIQVSPPKSHDYCLQVTGGVQQQVARLQVSMEHIGRVNVFEAAQNLVEKVADMVIGKALCLQQLVQVRLHQTLDNVDILHQLNM